MLLAYSSRKDFYFFHRDSDNIFRNTINRNLYLLVTKLILWMNLPFQSCVDHSII